MIKLIQFYLVVIYMKFSPIIIFIIILLIFVGLYIYVTNVSIFPSKRQERCEGFIDFQQSVPTNTFIQIPQYSQINTVLKLYDNIFFDNTNGNLIEVDGQENGSEDTTGSTIQNLYITTRNEPMDINTYSIKGKVVDANIEESKIPTVENSYVAFSYQNQSAYASQSVTFYTAWQDLTCLNVFSNTNNMDDNNNTPLTSINLIQSYLALPGSSPKFSYIETTDFIDNKAPYYKDTDPNNNTFVIEPLYNPNVEVYQISHFVKYDMETGNLIMMNGDNTNDITVYDSNGNVIDTNTPSKAHTTSINKVNLGGGCGKVTPSKRSIPTTASPKTPTAPEACKKEGTTVNVHLDPASILAALGDLAKPFLNSLAETANKIPVVTTPKIIDFRTNFADAFILYYPNYNWDHAYTIADAIYNSDIDYYSKHPNQGTIEGQIIGTKAFTQYLDQPLNYGDTAGETPTSVTTSAFGTPYITTPTVTTGLNASEYNELYKYYAALYAWGYYVTNLSSNPGTNNICYYAYAFLNVIKNVQTKIPQSEIISSMKHAYTRGFTDDLKFNLTSVSSLPKKDISLIITENAASNGNALNEIAPILYAFGYAFTNVGILQSGNKTDVDNFKDLVTKAANYIDKNLPKPFSNYLNSAFTAGQSDSYSIYSGTSGTPEKTPTKEGFTSGSSDITFQPFVVIDTYGQNVVIYNQVSQTEPDVVIIVGGYSDATNKVFEIINVVRFDKDGVDTGMNAPVTGPAYNTNKDLCLNPYKRVNDKDYILKTQIQPSMYNNKCSMCDGKRGACMNCGGNGGCGTLATNGVSVIDKDEEQGGEQDNEQDKEQDKEPEIPYYAQQLQKALENTSTKDVPLVNSSSNNFIPVLNDFSNFGR